MNYMNVLMWIVFGIFVGIISDLLDPASSRGQLFNSLVLGIGGALIGGIFSIFLFDSRLASFSFTSFSIAVLGALCMLYVSRMLRGAEKKHSR